MKVYLDVCCLNRPIDDRSQERIRSEAEAVEQVLIKIEAGVCDMVASDALDKEIALNPDPDKRLLVQRILASAVARVSATGPNIALNIRATSVAPFAFRLSSTYPCR